MHKRNTTRSFPLLQWLPGYTRTDFKGDTLAGVTTAVMLIPQAMAYAMLAGLPPIVGLYASTIPLAIYAFFGSSRVLAVGPVAMVSLMVAAGIGSVEGADSVEAIVALAVLLALMVGVLQLTMGIVRLGFLVNFLSHPVISGFTSAAALIIGFSQLKHLLGISIPRSHHVHTIVGSAVAQFGEVSLLTFALGVGSVVVLVGLKAWKPNVPRALIVVVVGTLAVWGFDLHNQGVAIVGSVPAGLPSFAWPTWNWQMVEQLGPIAVTIALVSFMESISVAKAFASRSGHTINANQELVGLGLSNIMGSFFGAYPVTGGFSRTAVNAQAGARTPMASLFTAGIVVLALLFLTPLFHYLPKAVLAAIIMTAVFGLVDIQEVRHLYKVKRSDLGLLVLTFVATLLLGIEQGIAVGVGASLLWFVMCTTRPHTAVLGRLPGTEVYRNIKNFPEAETAPGVLILRMDAQFYFGNVTFLKETLKQLEAASEVPLHTVILDASSIDQLDSSADTALHALLEDYQKRNIALLFAGVKGPVRVVMKRSGLSEKVGNANLFLTVRHAAAPFFSS